MKPRSLLLSLFVVLLVGCASVGRTVVNEGDDAVRLIGDDILRLISKNGDEIAQTSQQYAHSVGSQAQYSDEAIRYWDDVIRSSQTFDENALALLYRPGNLTPLQDNFVTSLQTGTTLSRNESLLYMQEVCYVANYVQYFNQYPSQSSAQFYVEQVAEHNGILIFSIGDFTESALKYATWLIQGDGSYSQQDGAKLLFDGLCLVSDVVDN